LRVESARSESHASGPRPSWRARIPFYYGWVVVASVFLVQAVGYGVYYSFTVFFVAMLEEFGWSRAATAGVFSVYLLVIGFGGILSGRLIDRFGPSRVVPVGGMMIVLGLVASSRLSQLWEYYLYFGLICGVGLALAGWVPCVAVVGNWFLARRGLAIGIASAGIGLGIVVIVPLSQWLISEYGWRSAYLILAVVALVGIAPQAALLQVGRPEDIGMKPDGPAPAEGAQRQPDPKRRRYVVVDEKWAAVSWTVESAMRTARFWLIMANVFLSILTNQMLWAHQAAYLVDSGYDKMLAASLVGFAGLISMPAKVLWGIASDRFGRELTFILGTITMLISIGVLVVVGIVPAVWLVLLFALLFAAGYSISAPISPSAAADLFTGRSFGSIFGVLSVGIGTGGAFGAWLAGFVYDTTGSYLAAFALAAACTAASALALWLAAPRKVRRVMPAG
jgi:MFS family permease